MDPTVLKQRLKIGGVIEKVNGKKLSYIEFVERYLSENKPVVVTDLMDDWRASKDWVNHDGSPNLKFMSLHFGQSKVQVADCGNREFTDQKRVEMSVSEYIDYWVALSEESKGNQPDMSTDSSYDKCLLYLKDWHFVKEYPEYVAYSTPMFFNDDWLNFYLDEYHMHNDPDYQGNNEVNCSDYRFVYMGPKGTWTPLHADVFRSYSWSANVCGTKLWVFLPPDQRHLVFDRYMKNSVYNIFEDVNESMFPEFNKAVWLECTQLKNEIIFVPSGWYHQVHNLEDTISINHNWFNSYNLDRVWDLLVGDYNEAKELIEDIRDICDDFESLCQRNLAANTGMNLYDFFTFITRVALSNLVQLRNLSRGSEIHSLISCPLAHHLILNLMSIKKVALKMGSTCLAEYGGISLEIANLFEDPSFVELCSVMSRTYVKLHDQCSHSHSRDTMDVLKNGFELVDIMGTDGSLVSNSRDLVSLIDRILNDYKPLLDNLLVPKLKDDQSTSS